MNRKIINKWLLFPLLLISIYGKGQEKELTLSGAIEKALENNYGVVISRSDVEVASINNNWGNAGRYPSVGFDASSSNNIDKNNTANYTSNRLSGGMNVTWTLFDGFQVNVTKEKLGQLETLAEGRSDVVIESTIQDVITGYYQVLLQKEKLSVLEKVMSLSRDRYDYEQARHELGGIVTFQVLQAKNNYLDDKAAFMNQEVSFRNSVRNLNFLMTEEPSIMWSFTDPFEPGEESYQFDALLEKMLSNNRTLQNQYISLLLQQSEVKLKRGTLYPSLSLSAGADETYTYQDRAGTDPTSSTSLNSYGNLMLSYDIYTGGTRKRAIEVAKINEEIVQIENEQMKHSLTNQLMNVFDYYNVRKALLEVAEESLQSAELNLQIADDKFRAGVINSFNYRDIQLIYLNSAQRKLEAIYNLIDSRTTLTRLTGGFISGN